MSDATENLKAIARRYARSMVGGAASRGREEVTAVRRRRRVPKRPYRPAPPANYSSDRGRNLPA